MLSPSDQLEHARAAFSSWRDSLNGRHAPIPDELWQLALSLLDHLSPTRVCRELRLDPTRLRKRLPASESASPPDPAPAAGFCQLDPTLISTSNDAAPPASAPHPSTALPLRLVCERADGTRLCLSLPASNTSQLLALYSLFLRG
jgi:hypothetical protein